MEFIIDETFGVPGVGTVVAGTLKQGVIATNSNLLLGPSPIDGAFTKTAIKSIHYKRLAVPKVCTLTGAPSTQVIMPANKSVPHPVRLSRRSGSWVCARAVHSQRLWAQAASSTQMY